jgi:hypothetical protein
MEKPRSAAAPIIAALMMLLPVLYVSSYLALVLRDGIPRIGVARVDGQTTYSITNVEHYRVACDKASWFYWPLEQLDRTLQPGAWSQPHLRTDDFLEAL